MPSGSRHAALRRFLRRRAVRALLALGIGVALGVGLARLSERPSSVARTHPQDGPGPRDHAGALAVAELEILRQTLEEEISARIVVTEELARLREDVTQMVALIREREGEGLGDTGDGRSVTIVPANEVPEGDRIHGTDPEKTAPPPSRPPFDREALIEAGLSPRQAERLEQSWERYQLERVDLSDRAMRGDYLMTPEHRQEQWMLEQTFRKQIGDDAFDLLLFATNNPNRVVVRQVLGGSAAASAGLEPGDAIIRYDGYRMFRPGELMLATGAGDRGEPVAVEVMRGGELLTFHVERGPLGAMIAPRREPPLGAQPGPGPSDGG